jgi:DNA ligase 1
MKKFIELLHALVLCKDDEFKILLIQDYLNIAEEDSTWSVALLLGKTPKRIIDTKSAKKLLANHTLLPDWLVDESHLFVSDAAETIALILPDNSFDNKNSIVSTMLEIKAIRNENEPEIFNFIQQKWRQHSKDENVLFNKWIMGTFRSPTSEEVVLKAIANHYDVEYSDVAVMLKSDWSPYTHTLNQVLQTNPTVQLSKPYAVVPVENLINVNSDFGKIENWIIEYKHIGIYCQIIKRDGKLFIWDKKLNLISAEFPFFHELETINDDFVIECVVNQLDSNGSLQPLIRTKTKKEVGKIWLVIFDILEFKGEVLTTLGNDIRFKYILEIILS